MIFGRDAPVGLDGLERPRSDRIRATLACKSSLAASSRVVEIEPLEFVILRPGDRKVGVGPAVRRLQNFVEDRGTLPVDRPVVPQLDHDLSEIARIEDERIFTRQADTTITPEFKPKR